MMNNNIFTRFNDQMSRIVDGESKIAVAVSGGSDSLALSLLLNQWIKNKGGEIVCITIDHKLRVESSNEAIKVGNILRDLSIKHYIIEWFGKKTKSNLQEKARIARYNLLTDYCHQHNIEYLATGHQRNDQAENFIIRADHGSGVYGLAGIPTIGEFNKIKIIRPLLEFKKEELQALLKEENIEWIEDPSNQNEHFMRVKVRKLLNEYPEWIDKLANISNNLSKAKECIEYMLKKSITELVTFPSQDMVLIELLGFNQLPQEIRFRMISTMLQNIGSKDKPARAERIERLLNKVAAGNLFKASTLGGCLISRKKGQLVITREELM